MPDVCPWLSTGLVEGAATPYPEPLTRPIYIAGGGDHMSLEMPGRSCSPQLRAECVGVERPGHLASARTTSGVHAELPWDQVDIGLLQPCPCPIRLPPLPSGCF